MAEELPVRYCHGCGQFDDHPRAFAVSDLGNAAVDELYHYDCLPPEYTTPEVQAGVDAANSGKRGQEVREAVLANLPTDEAAEN